MGTNIFWFFNILQNMLFRVPQKRTCIHTGFELYEKKMSKSFWVDCPFNLEKKHVSPLG